jgi:hypothetical protein
MEVECQIVKWVHVDRMGSRDGLLWIRQWTLGSVKAACFLSRRTTISFWMRTVLPAVAIATCFRPSVGRPMWLLSADLCDICRPTYVTSAIPAWNFSWSYSVPWKCNVSFVFTNKQPIHFCQFIASLHRSYMFRPRTSSSGSVAMPAELLQNM